MTDEIFLTRGQLRRMRTPARWFDKHMKGRGKIAFSKLITCAPPLFSPLTADLNFSGVVAYDDGVARDRVAHYRNGQLHREDGPAIHSKLDSQWWVRGMRHRLDGPAWVGHETSGKYWYILGVELRNHEEFELAIEIFEQNTHQNKEDPEISRAIFDFVRVRRQREREKELAKEAGQ